jgi:hypothetical protein
MSYEVARRPPGSQRLAFVGCEVIYREVCFLTASCRHMIDHIWLSQGLHDLGPEKMSARIQETVDTIEEGTYDAILLGFALCNNGIVGVRANHTPLVVPKAHDCITLFLGSRGRYREYFDAHPGTYYLTSGWIERDTGVATQGPADNIADALGLGMSLAELREKYGDENAAFIAETLQGLTRHYSRIAFIEAEFDAGLGFREAAEEAAREKGWEFSVVPGDLSLLRRLLNGPWDEDFAVVEPGCAIGVTHDADIIAPCSACGPNGVRPSQ